LDFGTNGEETLITVEVTGGIGLMRREEEEEEG